jgi:site-specific DNA-methyltransferase (adenine-specific)
MSEWKICNQDIKDWVDTDTEMYHALLSDPPYNLESISKRFGKENSSPAKFGTDGAFSRASRGFMNKLWDTGIAFDVDLWKKIKDKLYPGAFGMCFMGSRTYYKLATALDQAGFILHPMIGWIHPGFPKATRIDKQIDASLAKTWEGYRYGLQALKPCLEPIIVFQKPYEGRPVDNITKYGSGALNIAETKFSKDRSFVVNRFTDGMKPFGNAVGHEFESTQETMLWPANVIIGEDVEEPFVNFFYQAKASQKEKNAGLDDKMGHPTIKPIDLVKYLSTLLLPPKEYSPRKLLVPFSGTGSEVIGGLLAGWDYVEGIELEKESFDVSIKRIEHWIKDKE